MLHLNVQWYKNCTSLLPLALFYLYYAHTTIQTADISSNTLHYGDTYMGHINSLTNKARESLEKESSIARWPSVQTFVSLLIDCWKAAVVSQIISKCSSAACWHHGGDSDGRLLGGPRILLFCFRSMQESFSSHAFWIIDLIAQSSIMMKTGCWQRTRICSSLMWSLWNTAAVVTRGWNKCSRLFEWYTWANSSNELAIPPNLSKPHTLSLYVASQKFIIFSRQS